MSSVKAPIARSRTQPVREPNFSIRLRQAIVELGNAFLADSRNHALCSRLKRSEFAAQEFHDAVSRLAFKLSALETADLEVDFPGVLHGARVGKRCFREANAMLCIPRISSPEELGRGYEAMLDWSPVFDRDTGKFQLSETGDRRRKECGSYYTSSNLVDCLLDFALEPILTAACSQADPKTALLSLRICDPACGAGYFLLAAARRLAKRLADGGGKVYRNALRTVIARCIFGVDQDGTAVEVCRLALLDETKAPVSFLDWLNRNIVRADSLLDGNPFPEPFDLIIGNPPHGALREPDTRRRLEELYPRSRSAANSAAYFMEMCQSWTRPQGIAGFIIPKSLTYSHDWSGLRQYVGDRMIALIDAGKAWNEVRLEQVACVWRPLDPIQNGLAATGCWTQSGVVVGEPLDLQIASKLDVFHAGSTSADRRLLRHLLKAESTLGDICSTRRGSALQREIQQSGAVPVIGGRDLADFRVPTVRGYLSVGNLPAGTRLACPPQAAFQNIIAHITRPAPHIRLIGTVLRAPVACLDTVNLLTSRDPCWTAEALAGLLMTDLIHWFVYVGVFNRAIRTMHFDGFCLQKIPAPPTAFAASFHAASCRIEANPDDPNGWQALNDVAYDAYRIPQTARRIVAAAHKPRYRDPAKSKVSDVPIRRRRRRFPA